MVNGSVLRSATSLRFLCEVAVERGVPLHEALAGTGLTGDDLEQASTQIRLSQELRTIENVIERSGKCVGLGAAVGRRMHAHSFGIWGFAILTSPTLREAIVTAIDYIKLSLVISDLTLEESKDRAHLRFDMSGLPESVRPFVAERHAVVTMTFIEELMRDLAKDEYILRTTASDETHSIELGKILRIRVTTNEVFDALEFPSAWLDAPLEKSDPTTLTYCLDQCEALMAKLATSATQWSQRVKDTVIQDISTERKIDEVAEKLSVTGRTLRRRLTDEGTNFRELYTDTRLEIARELLEQTGLNVETVSWRVGYAEPASFVRAFSRKFGLTPGQARKTTG